MKTRARLLVLSLFLWNCAYSVADENTMSAKMEIYSTYHCVGLDISYQGDDNANLNSEFQYRRKGDPTWKDGVEMTFDRKRKRIWASAFRFNPGDEVEIRITLTDPDGVENQTLEGRTTLRTPVAETSGGRDIHVDVKATGRGDGTKSSPYTRISDAIKALKPGDTVWIHPGIYHESIELGQVHGTPEKPIVIRGTVTNITATEVRPQTPFSAGESGVMPVLTSFRRLPSNAAWKEHGNDIYSTPVEHIALDQESRSRMNTGYVTLDEGRMYCYRTVEELKKNVLEASDRKKGGVESIHTARVKGNNNTALRSKG
jgi:hypothetical protein